MSGKIVRLRPGKIVRNATSLSRGRRGNDASLPGMSAGNAFTRQLFLVAS
jgi:hypothetical protein